MRIENDFHINGCALSLALKQRLGPTWEWPETDFTALSYILSTLPSLTEYNVCRKKSVTIFLSCSKPVLIAREPEG